MLVIFKRLGRTRTQTICHAECKGLLYSATLDHVMWTSRVHITPCVKVEQLKYFIFAFTNILLHKTIRMWTLAIMCRLPFKWRNYLKIIIIVLFQIAGTQCCFWQRIRMKTGLFTLIGTIHSECHAHSQPVVSWIISIVYKTTTNAGL